MKYLEVEGAPDQGGLRMRGGSIGQDVEARKTDLRSDVFCCSRAQV